jgi:hypothetical protein
MASVESWEDPYELVQAEGKRPGHIQVTIPYWIYNRVVEFLKIHAIHARRKSVEIDHLDLRRCMRAATHQPLFSLERL